MSAVILIMVLMILALRAHILLVLRGLLLRRSGQHLLVLDLRKDVSHGSFEGGGVKYSTFSPFASYFLFIPMVREGAVSGEVRLGVTPNGRSNLVQGAPPLRVGTPPPDVFLVHSQHFSPPPLFGCICTTVINLLQARRSLF
ncbi:hypothetical protein LIER_27202 [Lithospermum erythrorhizon]|uniref:Secreted protein n=1 Tax=Lithospermum erythrorhizon TaxID=34254 RepID=A0AAV3RB64_LITER